MKSIRRYPIIDAHLDLGMNAVEWNRDLRLPIAAIRKREEGLADKLDRGLGTVSLPALRAGNVGVVVATQLARYVPAGRPDDGDPYWNSPEIAWAITQAQRSYYQAMELLGEMRQLRSSEDFVSHLTQWERGETTAVGYVLSLEGADSLVNLDFLYEAYGYGLRALGVSHYGQGRYAGGSGTTTGFSDIGRELLREMESLQMILDVTHLTDLGFDQALAWYNGPVWASHHNCRALVEGQRQLTDSQILQLIERGGVIGAALDAWMLTPDWIRGHHVPLIRGVGLDKVIDHWDHICQLAGNSLHCAIGSDLDGMFGTEQSPYDLDSIADLQLLAGKLLARGYGDEDVQNIFFANWKRFLIRHLPKQ